MNNTEFRAYIKSLELMRPVDRINFDVKTVELHLTDSGDYHNDLYEYDFDEIELMQYTGLRDRNKTKIFVKDVLELINEVGERVVAICKFGNRRLKTDAGNIVDIQCFYFEVKGFKTSPVVCNYKGLHDLEIMEVRGNILEDPELLNI